MAFNIKSNALIDLFEKYKGKSLCSLETDTLPHLKKTGRVTGKTFKEKFGVEPEQLHKLSKFSAGIGYEYANVVMNRLIKDGASPFDYQPGNTWHEPYKIKNKDGSVFESTVIRKHKSEDDLYFFVTLIANNPPKVEYKAGDKVLTADELAEFLDVPSKPKNQGLEPERTIEVRTFKLTSVKKVKAEGSEFVIEA